jgi:methionine-rich copper-binding protein CopC
MMFFRSILLVAALVLPASAAFAHAHLQSAVPPVGSTVEQAPTAITISFSEALEPRFSTIEVSDETGQRVDDGTPHTADGDAKRLSVGLKKLSPGIYKVQWHATSVDTHRTEGDYHFTVK